MAPIVVPAPVLCGSKQTPKGAVTCQRVRGHDTRTVNHAARNTAGSLLSWGTYSK